MKSLNRAFLAILLFSALLAVPLCRAQTAAQNTAIKSAATPETDAQKKNTMAYIDLLRRNVRQDKAEIMGSVMALNAADAAKFWPIYSDYDTQLAKLNDQRIQNIKEYAQSYNDMTDQKADELIQKSLTYQRLREELVVATYDKMKQALGAITAARFLQVEHQLLLIIDLQIDSALPVVGQTS
jgi:hypothetical protein